MFWNIFRNKPRPSWQGRGRSLGAGCSTQVWSPHTLFDTKQLKEPRDPTRSNCCLGRSIRVTSLQGKNLLLAPLPLSLSTSWLVCPYLVWQLITKELCSTEKYFENSNFEYKYKFSYFIKFNPDDAGFQPWVRFILPLTSQNIFRQDVTKNGVWTSKTPPQERQEMPLVGGFGYLKLCLHGVVTPSSQPIRAQYPDGSEPMRLLHSAAGLCLFSAGLIITAVGLGNKGFSSHHLQLLGPIILIKGYISHL